MSCIEPSSLGGGEAVGMSSQTGYEGSPGSSTVKYVSEDGNFSAPELGFNNVMQVGAGGKTKPMVPVRYNINKSSGNYTMSVTFEDEHALKLSRKVVVLAQPGVSIPSSDCLIVLGSDYHFPAGAPENIDNLRGGTAPIIKDEEGNDVRLGRNVVYYKSSELAGAIQGEVGSALLSLVRGSGDLKNDGGSILSMIQDIARKSGARLVSNEEGKIDIKSSSGGGSGINVGACEIISISESGNFNSSSAKGVVATYNHDDTYLKTKQATFKSLDLNGLPMPDCEGKLVNLLKEDMDEAEQDEVMTLLKWSLLSSIWNNWEGLDTYVYLSKAVPAANQTLTIKKGVGNGGTECQDLPDPLTGKNYQGFENSAIDRVFGNCLGDTKLYDPNQPLLFANSLVDVDSEVIKANGGAPNGLGEVALVNMGGGNGMFPCEGDGGENEEEGGGESSSFDEIDPAAKNIAGGAFAHLSNMLRYYAESIGRFYFISGGGAGGGAGVLTKVEFDRRNWDIPDGASISWFHKDTSVSDTPFREIYEGLYSDRMKEKNKEGGVEVNENGDKKEMVDLSISQFLQMATKEKFNATNGEEDDVDKTFTKGKGVGAGELAEQAEKDLQNCIRKSPKGIVILDVGVGGIASPEMNEQMKKIGGGVEDFNAATANDILKFLLNDVSLGIIATPGQHDEINKFVKEYEPRPGWKFGKQKTKKVPYEISLPRWYSDARVSIPDCESAGSFSVDVVDLSGQVLWRNIDCFGNELPWTTPFREQGQVNSALNKVVAEYESNNQNQQDDGVSTQITTCGDSVANMPGGGDVQDFNVQIGSNGDITTTFTVSSAESGIASSASSSHNYSRSGGSNAPNYVGSGPPLRDPMRGFRNPKTK